MTIKATPPPDFVRECLTYNPISGDLFWVERPRAHFGSNATWVNFNTNFAGTIAGCRQYQRDGVSPSRVAVSITFNGRAYRVGAHQLAYNIMGIEVPDGCEVDHRDCDPWNNAWLNLRIASHSQNSKNRKKNRGKKEDLPKGVARRRSKFRATIRKDGKDFRLGTFDTPEEAHAAYCTAAEELHKDFARFN